MTSTQKHARTGSTERTRHLAEKAAGQIYTRWDEWRALVAKHSVEEDMAPMAQAAHLFAGLWSNLPPCIREDELIVGARRRASPDLPGAEAPGWIPDAGDEVRQYAKRMPQDRPDLVAMGERGLLSLAATLCHRVSDYPAIIGAGLNALIARADELAATRQGDELVFTRAVATGMRALVAHAANYAREASRLAAETADPHRAAELCEIARICAKVPAAPAETFHEAIQSYWFLYMASGWDLGRVDQLLYPYYARDLAAGRITPERALELIECLFIKVHADYTEGDCNVSSIHTLTLGGLTPDGGDAANAVTGLILEALHNIRLPRPTVYLRCHARTDEALLLKAAEMLGDGLAMPNLYNDTPIVEGLVRIGIAPERARDYALGGCTEIVSPGKGNWGAPNGWINLALLADEALRDAARRNVCDSRTFWRILAHHIETAADACRDVTAMADAAAGPEFCTSFLTPCCLEAGRDLQHGGAETWIGQWAGIGLPNAADMLFTAQRLAFDGPYALADLVAAVDAQDDAIVRQIRALPKYGNGQTDVDALANRLIVLLSEALEKRSTPQRSCLTLGHLAGGQNMHIDYGRHMGATLDGRPAGATLADSLACAHGKAKGGPTAILRSVCALDHSRLQAGNVTTLMLSPKDFRGTEGCRNVASLIRTFITLGGSQLQINLVDAATLREAQRRPVEHEDLTLRVAGYSARFVHIGKTLQEEIIARVETAD